MCLSDVYNKAEAKTARQVSLEDTANKPQKNKRR